MRLFEQLVTFNSIINIGNVFDVIYRENEEVGEFDVCNPIKVLILSDSMERATRAVECAANAIINPKQFTANIDRDEEKIYDLGLLLGLPFRFYTKLHQNTDVNALGDFDYIVYINYEKERRFIPNYECSITVIRKVISCDKECGNNAISDYIGGVNRNKLYHQTQSHILAISDNVEDSLKLYKSTYNKMGYVYLFEGYSGAITINTRHDETGEIIGKTKGIQGIPMMLMWRHKKYVDLSVCMPYVKYIILE